MAADCYEIVTKVLGLAKAGIVAAAGTAAVCLGLWHAAPLITRKIAKKMKLPGVPEGARHSR